MLHKYAEYQQALRLRQLGKSVREISKLLRISSSTASVWCRSIELSKAQREKLNSRSMNIELLQKFAQKRHEDKVRRNNKLFKESQAEIKKLAKQEFFLARMTLYWAEGFKNPSEGRVGFCNTDPRMIKFMMIWFQKFLKINSEDFTLRAEFNISHASRQLEIETYWSEVTGIPLSQFNRPYLQKSVLLRNYSNSRTYFGVLRLRVRRSTAILPKLRGWIEGLSKAY